MFDPEHIGDPRRESDFQARHFPLCDGGEPPPIGSTDRIARRKLQFLAAYYRLNCLYDRLSSIRAGRSQESEAQVLQALKLAVAQRDQLELFYEAEGFWGEPIMNGMVYANVEFTYARRNDVYRPASSYSFSVFVPLPPAGENSEQWIREHLAKAAFNAPSRAATLITSAPRAAPTERKEFPDASRGPVAKQDAEPDPQ